MNSCSIEVINNVCARAGACDVGLPFNARDGCENGSENGNESGHEIGREIGF